MNMAIHNVDPEFQEFAIKMAEENVKFYENLAKGGGWRTRDKIFYAWFPTFAVIEFALTIWCLIDHNWWSATLSFVIGCSQIGLLFLNKRTKRLKQQNQADWLAKLAKARAELEALDPANRLVPLVIEEEP